MKIKCGRHEYDLQDGDYILDNEACLQFHPKDNSKLPFGRWHRMTSVNVSKKEWQRLLKLPNWTHRDRGLSMHYYFWKDLPIMEKKI